MDIKLSLVAVLGITIGIQEVLALRAQQSPCYEFVCGIDEAYLCGSDGVTYLNGCKYSQAQCKNPSLFVIEPGKCQTDDPTASTASPQDPVEVPTTEKATDVNCNNAFCTSAYYPVCGSDGITYSNPCQFSKAQCRNSALSIKHEGRCKNSDNCMFRICPMEENPVCASDGKTYRNECEYSIARCYDQSLVPIAVGPCSDEVTSNDPNCNRTCEDQYRPVCATDGQTYPNVCFFEKARCKNLKLKIYKFEPC